MYEKLTARKQIRLTERMAREVERLADLEIRDFDDQIRFLIELALRQYRSRSKPTSGKNRQALPPDVTSQRDEEAL